MAPTVGEEIPKGERKRDEKRKTDREREKETEKKENMWREKKSVCTRGRGIKLFDLYIKH